MYELSLLEYLIFCTGFGVWFVVATVVACGIASVASALAARYIVNEYFIRLLVGARDPECPEVAKIAYRRLREMRATSLDEWEAMNPEVLDDD
ncbi:MAG TPA: hypothetical protein EYO33_21065 [Phycisphaerales bacterium]|nr:hypothetical protein [Phycisphaerales bacterium]